MTTIAQLLETHSTPVDTQPPPPPQPELVTNSGLALPSPQDASAQVEHSCTEHSTTEQSEEHHGTLPPPTIYPRTVATSSQGVTHFPELN